MATHLKRRIAQDVTDEIDRKVRQTVEGILEAVRKRGDATPCRRASAKHRGKLEIGALYRPSNTSAALRDSDQARRSGASASPALST